MNVAASWMLGCVVLTTGCGDAGTSSPDSAGGDGAVLDALTDPWLPEPFSVSGTTPLGSADVFHYIHARYASHWCGYKYQIELTRTELRDNASPDPYLMIEVPMAVDAVDPLEGEVDATVFVSSATTTLAVAAGGVFQATVVDPPSVDNARVSGRVIVNEAGWDLDFAVALTSRGSFTCN